MCMLKVFVLTDTTKSHDLWKNLVERWRNNMLSVWIFLLLIDIQLTWGLTSEPSMTSEFTPSQLVKFTDPDNNSSPYFHYLTFDPNNKSRIYIGAVDFLYRLNADNISLASTRSVNLTAVREFRNIIDLSLTACRDIFQAENPGYRCRNHIRAAFPINSKIYICATGAQSPQEFFLDYESLAFVALTEDPIGMGSGVTKCPSDPDAQYTILFVDTGNGTPSDLPAIYSSVNARYMTGIYRSRMQLNTTSSFQPERLQLLFQDITFVASYEIDQYVYYFYREIAAEASECGTFRYARVARVCKNDRGNFWDNQFITFAKVRLNCSLTSGADIPIYYNELNDVLYDASNRIFYGLFMGNQNTSWGSAICQYSYSSIADKFDNGQFFSQEQSSAPWRITPDSNVPNPRPSVCRANDTRTLPLINQSFAITHTLMAGTIDQMTTMPLYFSRDIGYSHMVMDVVSGFEGNFTVFCLYSESRPDDIVRVVQWTKYDATSSRIFSVLKPFAENKSPLRQMMLQKSSGKTWLYLVKDTAVFQISMDICSQYRLCTECVIDPYCGWNSSSQKCLPYSTGLLQNVTSSSALTACNAVCKVSTSSSQFCIPGMALHMNCSSHCSPEGSTTWLFPNGSVVPVWPSHPNYVLTHDGGLVILNLSSNLTGTFKCLSNNVVLAEHSVKTSSCQYSDNIQEIVATEYNKWCQIFGEYKAEYNEWFCSRKNCSPDFCKIYNCGKK